MYASFAEVTNGTYGRSVIPLGGTICERVTGSRYRRGTNGS